ncbi:Galactosyl transferase [Artemisia annua]|uniref:Galactosyl transferase n=1 Tax=Artemisia annua TaxID=35608 RepID=A0A2U1PWW9_ARTAN|nr:Galactosyl transferase [Artemisia annua]
MMISAHGNREKRTIRTFDRRQVFLAGVVTALVCLCTYYFLSPSDLIPIFPRLQPEFSPCHCDQPYPAYDLQFDPPNSTFYDDPSFGYTINTKMENWDQKRQTWLNLHPTFKSKSQENLFIVTGSRPTPCKSPTGDHYLLRTYRNKVDYCRIHGYDIFYNNVLLDPFMPSWWSKIPVVRAAMVAHPEAEWIWWLDEDTVITDMEYKIPFHRYKDYNFVVHGWPKEVYQKKRWLGLNAGSFLIRNCQWSLDMLDMWADMGPQSPNVEKWAKIILEEFKNPVCDQTALAYLIWKTQNESFGRKILIETGYYLEGYWVGIVESLKNITERYLEIEKRAVMLRRRHAEKVSEVYGVLREPFLKDAGNEAGRWRRPFVTHFAGCQPCSGNHNPLFTIEGCNNRMNEALNFADNQVLRNYGVFRHDLDNSAVVNPLPFDYPA